MNIRTLFCSQEGSVMPVIGVLVVALLGSAGAAVDTGRGQLVKAKLSSSLDAAGLAAGSTASTTSIQPEATKYLNANFDNYLGATITNVSISGNANNTLFTLSATAEVPTTFMRIMGIDKITVSAYSEITRAATGLELVMVLDNTGSMSGTKLTSLKTSATQLVNILFGDHTTVPNLWVGLVPFSQAVNVGDHPEWTSSNAFNWGSTSWGGCVDARETGNRDTTDEPPTLGVANSYFPEYYWPDDSNNNWISTSTDTTTTRICNKKTSCTCANYGPCTTTTSGNVTTTIACSGSSSNKICDKTVSTVTTTYTINSTHGPNLYCPKAVTPMTATKSKILDGITAMTAAGNTHIGLGAAWGWRMLSPRWQGKWSTEMNAAGLPFEYNKPKMNKAVIIMTDGDNTIDNSTRGAYWYLSNGKLGTTTQSTAENSLDTRLSTVCTSMKNNNIIVYTISFGTVDQASTTMLRNCASQASFYFPSPDGATLQTAFKAIGDSLASLRVSK